MKMYRETLFWSIFTCLLIGTEGSFEFLFNKCCKLGLTWAQQGNDCEKYLLPLNGISLDQQIPCLVTVEICCSRYARSHICEAGKDMAFSGSECKRTVFPGIDFRKDCCDGCKLGLITGSHGFSCSMKDFSFDYPWDEAFADCCELAQHSIVTSLITLPDANSNTNDVQGNRCDTSNPCQHHCKDTGYAIECSCRPGYDLALDKKSCIDIDECSLNQHSCDSSELCSNTEGSFLCLGEGDQLSPGRTPQHFGSFQTSPTTFSPDIQAGNNPFSGTCATGYAFNPISRTCNDIDECAEGRDLCNRQREFCLNLIGGYQCQPKNKNNCPAGYKFNNYIQSCEDVDECEENLHTCGNEEQCRNTIGGYECDLRCEQGFRYSIENRSCLDIDECAEQLDYCNDETEECNNILGSYECYLKLKSTCPAGYKPNRHDNTCEDVDECLENLHSCDELTETCVNEIGIYQCKPKEEETIECSDGYRYDSTKQQCLDIDECTEGTHDCDSEVAVCMNIHGGFRCQIISCPQGYRMNFSSRVCDDINECLENIHNCSSLTSECVNTLGGFQCQELVPRTCLPGYRYNGFLQTCEDVNECHEGLSTCDPQAETCVNNVGSYTCVKIECPSGFRPNVTSRVCIDINECEENLHNCSSQLEKCINTIGGYVCRVSDDSTCPSGHRYNRDQQKCEDVNECHEGTHTCSVENKEVCINTVGSFLCRILNCPAGYRPNVLARTCIDINECEENIHNCTQYENCVNTIGDYVCQQMERQSCSEGYRYDIRSSSCTDIDECLEGSSSCNSEREDCINVQGSYRCTLRVKDCLQGFKYNLANMQCEDVDECVENQHNCQSETQTCVNTFGTFYCQDKPQPSCPEGSKYNRLNNRCEDIDECAEQTDTCDRSIHTCINTVGSHRCILKRLTECSTGYRLDLITNKCIDMNECLEGLHDCDAKHYCVNTPGGYQCQPIEVPDLKCGNGFRLNVDKTRCEDIDECLENLHNCHPSAELCINIAGSFYCKMKLRRWPQPSPRPYQCPPGFTFNERYKQCQDINECQLGTHSCVPSQRCDNTIGSFTCIRTTGCGTGYTLNQGTGQCEDIDECIRGTHECRGGQKCINRAGGYACQCLPGYRMNENSECEDIDECTRYSRLCTENGECRNTPGSYVCECKSGFKQTDDGKTCIDMDECTQQYICHQKCINTWGSYKCACDQGYTLSSDGRTCQDIDECSLWKGRGNLCIGICVNEPGSYSCQCPAGYRLDSDKRTCQDIDECSQGNICKGDDEVCLNTRGSYRCNTIICPPNYNRDREHRNRCKRESRNCQQGDTECLRAPLSISFNYITFVSNMRIPSSGQLDLFTMRGPLWSSTTVQFSLELNSARAPTGIPVATRQYFRLRRTAYNQAVISLTKSIPGPQEIELELIMKLYSNNIYGGEAIAKIFIYVSQYEY